MGGCYEWDFSALSQERLHDTVCPSSLHPHARRHTPQAHNLYMDTLRIHKTQHSQPSSAAAPEMISVSSVVMAAWRDLQHVLKFSSVGDQEDYLSLTSYFWHCQTVHWGELIQPSERFSAHYLYSLLLRMTPVTSPCRRHLQNATCWGAIKLHD